MFFKKIFKSFTLFLGGAFLLASCSSTEVQEEHITVAPFNAMPLAEEEADLPKKIAVVNFDFDSAKMGTREILHLEESLDALNKVSSEYVIMVKGHADQIGTERYNEKLGLKRAETVKNRLIANGVDRNKIMTISYGEERPIVNAKSFDERRKNRRAIVELVAVDKVKEKSISMN